jgi:PAS domain S-box-containing protein
MVKKLVTLLKPHQWDRQQVLILLFVILASLILILKNSLIFTLSSAIVYFIFLILQKRNQFIHITGILISLSLGILADYFLNLPLKNIDLIFFNFLFIIFFWVMHYLFTDQEHLDKSIFQKNEQLKIIFEIALEGIIMVNEEGKIKLANNYAEKLFGYKSKELIGKKIEALIPSRFAEKHQEHRLNFAKSPMNRPMGEGLEVLGINKEGKEFPVSVSLGHSWIDEKLCILVFVHDITKRVNARNQLLLEKKSAENLNIQLEKKVQERTKKLEEVLLRLEQANKNLTVSEQNLKTALIKEKELSEIKSQFVTLATHEFKTPLTTILNSIFLLENGNSKNQPEVKKENIERIRRAIKNLLDIINDFLFLNRLEEGKAHTEYTKVHLDKLLEEIIDEVNLLKYPKQKIIVKNTAQVNYCLLDATIFKNILLNLFTNAFKFSPSEGTITLTVSGKKKVLTLEVMDEGIGIPKEEIPHIFSRFFRAKNAKGIDGTGLGLSITKKYVELLNGKINLKSTINKGTTFIVKIPIQLPAATE